MQRPLPLIATGVALVALDLRTPALDFLPDPLGWALIAVGAAFLGIKLAAASASLAALLSLAEIHLPYRYVLVDPTTTRVVDDCPSDLPLGMTCPEVLQFDPVSGWRLAGIGLAGAVGCSAVVGLILGLRRRALATGDRQGGQRMGVLATAVALAWSLPQLGAIGWAIVRQDGRYDVVWNGTAEYASLLGVCTLGWLVVELALHSGRRWALRGAGVPRPWSGATVPP